MNNEVNKQNILNENVRSVAKSISHFYNIGSFKNNQIVLYKLSFSHILKYKNEYIMTFGKDVIEYIFKSSGSCVIKKNSQYMIFINTDFLDKLSEETQNHIIEHEKGHIYLGHLENNDELFNKKVIRNNDKCAERYALKSDYKFKDSIFKISKWEVYSLFPKSNNYKFPKKVWWLRNKFYIRNLFVNICRKYFI